MREIVRSVGLALACGLLALAAGAASASAAPTWVAPQDISDLNHSITFPDVAVNAAGDAIGIWPRNIGGNETIVEAAARPAGGAWAAPVTISDPTEDEEPKNVHVALDTAGIAVAVWGAFGDHGNVIRAAVRSAGGEWSAPEDLSVEGGRAPWLAMNAAGDAVAAWTGFNGADEVIWAAVRPAGGDWLEPEEIPAGGDHGSAPRVAIDAAGDAVAAWSLIGGGIQAAVRPAGGDWSATEDVTVEDEPNGEPAVAIDSNRSAFAIWPNSLGVDRRVMRVATLPSGGEWSAPEDLSTETERFQSYELESSAAAGIVATWTRFDGHWGIQAAVRPVGGAWSAAEDLSADSENAGLPVLAFDANGDAIAIWGREVGTQEYILQGAGYDFAGPRLDDLRIPAAGTAGEPVSFAVSPFDVFSLGATSWTFGDGSQAASGNAVSHVYATPGNYPVTVSALDGSGNASTRTGTIAIAAAATGEPPPPPPPPTPQIALTLRIERESLRKLVRTGKLHVVARVNDAASVGLDGRAKLVFRRAGGGDRTRLVRVFVPKTVHLAAAGGRRVTLALSKRGRRALRSRSRARLQIAGKASSNSGGVAAKTVARTLR